MRIQCRKATWKNHIGGNAAVAKTVNSNHFQVWIEFKTHQIGLIQKRLFFNRSNVLSERKIGFDAECISSTEHMSANTCDGILLATRQSDIILNYNFRLTSVVWNIKQLRTAVKEASWSRALFYRCSPQGIGTKL